MYEYTDKIIRYLNKRFIALFNRLKTLSSFDEINALQAVQSVYDEADKLTKQRFLTLAKYVYETNVSKDRSSINEAWILLLLDAYDPVTKYVYTHEIDRKRARLFESLVASTTKSKEIDTALRYWSAMVRQYAIAATDAAVLQAYQDDGVQKVRWITTPDDRRCVECAKRDGKIYDIDNIPPKPHIGCRCRYERVR